MFEHALSECMSHQTESIHSTTTISFPFKVLSKIKNQRRLGFKDKATYVVYLDLEADKKSDYLNAEEENKIVIFEWEICHSGFKNISRYKYHDSISNKYLNNKNKYC